MWVCILLDPLFSIVQYLFAFYPSNYLLTLNIFLAVRLFVPENQNEETLLLLLIAESMVRIPFLCVRMVGYQHKFETKDK